MKKLSILLILAYSLVSFTSCNKKEEIAENPVGCGCSALMDCEAGCACGCQD
jgi:hypothetical protein